MPSVGSERSQTGKCPQRSLRAYENFEGVGGVRARDRPLSTRHRICAGGCAFSGVVLDPSGAVVPGATVLVKNERTGEERTVVTNAEGRYIVANLRPSVYTMRGDIRSARAAQFDGHPAGGRQEFATDLTLQAAGVTETVTVQAQVSAIDLSSAAIGVNVSEREVQNLPVNGRQMSQLMLQAPGSQNAGTGTWNDVRFTGRANEQNVIKLRRRRRLGDHRLLARQHRRRERLALQAAGEPRERAGVPRRVEQLPGGIRYRHRWPGQRHNQVGHQYIPWLDVRVLPRRLARCAELLRFHRNPMAASSRNCPSRTSVSISSAARSAVRSSKDARSSSAAMKAIVSTPA